jgi:hypothetical protein
MADEYGCRTEYMPGAVVRHRVPAGKTRLSRLLRRCYAQGQTKARLGVGDEERGFLREAVMDSMREPPVSALGSFAFLGATGAGYLSKRIRQH